tara:strand:- start:7653 stop:11918 length:4266 start_codon:yes stop_codon:yes gene_type:complete
MAEIKNSFLKSKMNKDLDDRLVPNGEYRDAQNVSVGKSEDDDIGALETILGNVSIASLGTAASNRNVQAIGVLADEARQQFYIFYTDYTGNDPFAPSSNVHYIYLFNPIKNIFQKLVEGKFLNFSTQFPVETTLVEDLLFFTDNRNQPRKINITRSLGYYTLENQLSVAKYNPYLPISLLKSSSGTINSRINNSSFTLNHISSSSTNSATTNVSTITVIASVRLIKPGMIIGYTGIAVNKFITILDVSVNGLIATLVLSENVTIASGISINFYPNFRIFSRFVSTSIKATEYRYIASWAGATATIEVYSTPLFLPTLTSGEKITFFDTTMTNESLNDNWPGDPDLLKDKFVRFSYRFQFDDGEFSIMAPFTQIAFIPKQQGYFVKGDQEAAYRSTVLQWMENNVQNVELIIPLPDKAVELGSEVNSKYKITAIELIYKESESLATRILEKIPISDINCSDCVETADLNYYTYNFQSRKPYKTLPTIQTTRVYDKVPTRALAQETAGNRIIYGNFWNQHTPPNTLNYRLGVSQKINGSEGKNFMEYPNHSLKQNRTYQAGVILADKWGRQSSVILSSVQEKETQETASPYTKYGGSTVYNGYKKGIVSTRNIGTTNSTLILSYPQLGIQKGMIISGGGIDAKEEITVNDIVQSATTTTLTLTAAKTIASNSTLYFNEVNAGQWFGDALQLSFDSPITSGRIIGSTPNNPFEANGEPGLYAIPLGDGLGFYVSNTTVQSQILDNTYLFKITTATSPIANRPVMGSFFRGQDADFVKVIGISTTTVGSFIEYTLTFNGLLSEIYTDVSGIINLNTIPYYAYDLNATGWYSYKIVVKQQEQEYYNVYLPGVLAGYPGQPLPSNGITIGNNLANGGTGSPSILYSGANYSGLAELIEPRMVVSGGGLTAPLPVVIGTLQNPINFEVLVDRDVVVGANATLNYAMPKDFEDFPTGEIGATANTVLINDNINKVPRDLTELGPEQRQFRSSVQLFGRVSNNLYNKNIQYYPGTLTDTAISISTANDSNFKPNSILENNYQNFYQIDTNPLIARIETQTQSETIATRGGASGSPSPGADVTLTLSSAPTPPILPGMIITDTVTKAVYGSVNSVISPTEIKCRLAQEMVTTQLSLTFTATIGSPSGRSLIEDFTLMQPTLAIYETEPVESLLDLYWESSTSGLIADLNRDIALNFDNTVPDRFSNFTFTLNENTAIGTNVTSSFIPQNKNGDFTDTFINMKVLNGNGINSTDKFELVSTITLEAGVSVTRYTIKTAAVFDYTHDSATVDVYNFYMTVRSPFNRPGTLPTNGSNLITFKGSLTNTAPVNQGTAGSVTKASAFIGQMVSLYSFDNGSVSGSKDGLKFVTNSYTNDGANYFNLDEFTGSLTKTAIAPAGTYYLSYQVNDSWNGHTLGLGTGANTPSAFTIVIT